MSNDQIKDSKKLIKSIKFHSVAEREPPFGKILLIKFKNSYFVVGRILIKSPNDEDGPSEYNALCDRENDYSEFQFYIQPSNNIWMGDIDLDMYGDSDLLSDYSDMIEYWALLPDLYSQELTE